MMVGYSKAFQDVIKKKRQKGVRVLAELRVGDLGRIF